MNCKCQRFEEEEVSTGLRQKDLLVKMGGGGQAEDRTQDRVSHLPGKQNRRERGGESVAGGRRGQAWLQLSKRD